MFHACARLQETQEFVTVSQIIMQLCLIQLVPTIKSIQQNMLVNLLAMQVELETQYFDIIKRIGTLFKEDPHKVKAELETTRYYQRMLVEIEEKLNSFK